MTNKQIINTCEFLDICVAACGGTLEDTEMCPCYGLHKQLDQLKAEIKLSKEMLIQNTSETDKYTIPQIIEQFISDNSIDQQNEDGYTIPIFIQLENILYEKEDLEEKLGFAKTSKGLLNKEIQKLSKTLEEIKEIAEKYKNLNFGEQQYCYSEILRKISECEVANDR